MILISHQRSGSEWFLFGLENIQYGGWEVLGDMDYIPGTVFTHFKRVSLEARIQMIKATTPHRAQKIHLSNLIRVRNEKHWEALLNVLQTRNDVYLLTRRNVRATFLSFAIAVFNNHNFHGTKYLLTKKFYVEREFLERWYRLFYTDFEWIRTLLSFKEEWVFEDLLDGTQVPTTVRWNAGRSPIQDRRSRDYAYLVQNYKEMIDWMDELGVPGQL